MATPPLFICVPCRKTDLSSVSSRELGDRVIMPAPQGGCWRRESELMTGQSPCSARHTGTQSPLGENWPQALGVQSERSGLRSSSSHLAWWFGFLFPQTIPCLRGAQPAPRHSGIRALPIPEAPPPCPGVGLPSHLLFSPFSPAAGTARDTPPTATRRTGSAAAGGAARRLRRPEAARMPAASRRLSAGAPAVPGRRATRSTRLPAPAPRALRPGARPPRGDVTARADAAAVGGREVGWAGAKREGNSGCG